MLWLGTLMNAAKAILSARRTNCEPAAGGYTRRHEPGREMGMSIMRGAVGRRLARFALLLSLTLYVVAHVQTSVAHEIQPAVVEIEVASNGALKIDARLNLEAFLANIGAGHADTDDAPTAALYDELRQLAPAALARRATAATGSLTGAITLTIDDTVVLLEMASVDVPANSDTSAARQSNILLKSVAPAGAETLVWKASSRFGVTALRVRRDGEDRPYYGALIDANTSSDPVSLDIAAEQSLTDIVVRYVVSGFDHIVPKGLDHILFVIGIFLLSPRLRPLLIQISSFTIAHSITLALGALGILSVPGAIVEPLIAASIVFIALENLATTRLHTWRPIIIFALGLLHGLGFASVFGAFGMPTGDFIAALLAFNVGVELGQLAVIAVCYLTVGFFFGSKPWYRRVIVAPASVAIAAIAIFWVLDRTGLLVV